MNANHEFFAFSNKTETRKLLRAQRKHHELQTSITPAFRKLLSALQLQKSAIALYYSYGTEPDTHSLIQDLHNDGHTIFLPYRAGKTLEWKTFTSQKELHQAEIPGFYEISESIASTPREAIDLFVVPALAVSNNGSRLGQGGGFYDRALENLDAKQKMVALVYPEEIIQDLPVEEHDIKVDYAITSAGEIYTF
ncbi:MAG: 5-formyltetrahydrofolate cyclo-ligase [Micrococcaceae bacterium]